MTGEASPVHSAPGVSPRGFGLVLAAWLGGVALWPLVRQEGIRPWMLGAALVVLSLSAVAPRLLLPASRAAAWAGLRIGQVVDRVLLAVLYYGVITPVAAALRLAGRNPLALGTDARRRSYWEEPERGAGPGAMRRQF